MDIQNAGECIRMSSNEQDEQTEEYEKKAKEREEKKHTSVAMRAGYSGA